MEAYTPTPRTQVKRRSPRGVYDKAQIHSILDQGFVCHLGFVLDGQPYVIPTAYARSGEVIYIHGSPASRIMRVAGQQLDICLTVTLVDGFVLARAVFHHSMNYRSVVVLGKASFVEDPAEKLEALRCFTEHLAPGRWQEARQPNESELKATSVLSLPLEEVSAKIRTGPPIDDEEDFAVPAWAGVVPVRTELGEPIPDQRLLPGVTAPDVAQLSVRRRYRTV
jgi:uncharacterized protein